MTADLARIAMGVVIGLGCAFLLALSLLLYGASSVVNKWRRW